MNFGKMLATMTDNEFYTKYSLHTLKFGLTHSKYYSGLFSDKKDDITDLWIFHHNDLDGYASAAEILYLLSKKYGNLSFVNINTMAINYINDIDTSNVNVKHSEAWFVDYSFSNKNNLNKFLGLNMSMGGRCVWVDHHKTSSDIIASNPDAASYTGLVDSESGLSGAMLVWYFINILAENLDGADNRIPVFVKYVSDWDTFSHVMKDVISFKFGIESKWSEYKNILISPNNMSVQGLPYVWNQALNHVLSVNAVSELINLGAPVTAYTKENYKKYDVLTGLRVKMMFNGKLYTVHTMNVAANSLAFGKNYDECDFVLMYFYKAKDHLYSYSLYRKETDNMAMEDVSEIAKLFGGGGHPGAAGFTLNFNIMEWEEDGVIDLDNILETIQEGEI